MNLQQELQFAKELGHRAGQRASSYQQPQSWRKADGSEVTEADRAVERFIVGSLQARFPDHAVLGEEFGVRGNSSADYTWVVDPIDGTSNYARGLPVYATLIALVVMETPVLGVVTAPALGHQWSAAVGHGATEDGRPIHVSGTTNPEDSLLLIGALDQYIPPASERDRRDVLLDFRDRFGKVRGYGDFWMHMLVARGSAEAAIESGLSYWDHAALVPIVMESGGRVTSYAGGPIEPDSTDLISSNGHVHETLLTVMTVPSEQG